MKHLVILIGYATVGLMAALFLMGGDRVVPVTCGQGLDATVNADDPTIGTRFQLNGGCTYPVDTVVALKNGDEIAGPVATFKVRPPRSTQNPQSPSRAALV